MRQLDRQINSQFYERATLPQNKAALLEQGSQPASGDAMTLEEAIKDSFVLELLGLKDHYSESDMEDALDNLPNKVIAAEYQMVLPNEKRLAEELERSRRELESRRPPTLPAPPSEEDASS